MNSGTRGGDTEESALPTTARAAVRWIASWFAMVGMLDVGDAFRREQRREDVAVLASLARGERGKRPDRQAEIEADAVKVAGADAGTGQNEQTVLGQKLPEFVHERKDRLRAAIHDGAAADLHDLQPGQEPDRALAGDGAGEVAVEQGLARERRGDVLDGVGGFGHGAVL